MSWIKEFTTPPPPATPKQLRSFGLIVGGIFAVIGLFPWLRGHAVRPWAIVLGAVLVLFALIAPKALTWVHRVWMMAGQALGAINSRIILTLIFYGVLTPMGAVMRLWRRDPMYRALEPSATTYRVVRQARPASHMKQQF